MKNLHIYIIFFLFFHFCYSIITVLLSETGPSLLAEKSFFVEGVTFAFFTTIIFYFLDQKYFNKWED